MKTTPAAAPVKAISYIRFSHPDQSKGDSLRRQTDAAVEWCKKNGVTLDTSITYRDLGKSAYTGAHRENPDRNALAAILKLVESGKVPRGAYLIIENLDRLSREHIQPALLLTLNLLQAGVRIVQLKPAEMVFDDKSDTMPVMMMMMELSRGHGESAMKSERIGAAWKEKRRRARAGEAQAPTKTMGDGCRVLTRRLPGWVEKRGGKLHLIPAHAATVKHIFQLSGAGYGHMAIVKKLEAEKVPTFLAVVRRRDKEDHAAFTERPGRWNKTYVKILLNDRRTLGEFQLHNGDGTPDGEPIPDYFPAAVTEQEWYAARSGCSGRDRKKGRQGKHLDLFNGLLRDARDGGTMMTTTRTETRPGKVSHQGEHRHSRLIVNTSAAQGHTTCMSFPQPTFERAILTLLREVVPREILGGKETDDTAARISTLEGEQGRVGDELAEATVFMKANGFSPTIGKRVTELEARKRELEAELEGARATAARPLEDSWKECKTLLEALDNAPDREDARLRLRAALRRIVDSIYLLSVPRGRDRLCAVQVWFTGGEHRDYLILHRPSKANRSGRTEGYWQARSITGAELAGVVRAMAKQLPDDCEGKGEARLSLFGGDLRDVDEAARAESYLQALPTADLDNLVFGGFPKHPLSKTHR